MVRFNDFELDFTILENIEQVVGNLSCSDNHQALNHSRSYHIMELNDVQAVTCDIDFVAGIQSEVTVRDFQVPFSLNGTDNDISKFLAELGNTHLAEIAVFLEFELHQCHSPIGKVLY